MACHAVILGSKNKLSMAFHAVIFMMLKKRSMACPAVILGSINKLSIAFHAVILRVKKMQHGLPRCDFREQKKTQHGLPSCDFRD